MTQSKKDGLSLKKILLVAIPIVAGLILILVIKEKKKRETENNKSNSENYALIPNSENEERIPDKVLAYKEVDNENRRKEREKKESIVRNSDFFHEVAGDEEVKPNENEDIKDFYERTVINKVSKNDVINNRYYKSNKTSSKNNNFYQENEEDILEAQYVKAINVGKKKEEPIKEKPSKESTKGKNNSLQDRLNNFGEKKQQEREPSIEEYEQNYKRSRKRKSSGINSSEIQLIRACIHGDQTITEGSSVRMRLLSSVIINSTLFPKNTIFYGIAQISKDRLNISVKSVKLNDLMQNVNCQIYDNDGIKGLNLPDNIKEELAKKGKDTAIDQVNIETGLVGSALSSLGKATKSVLKKDNAQIKVTLKANYQIFINQQD